MPFLLDKFHIIQNTETVFKETTAYVKNVENINFFKHVEDKWSIAENIQHLTISTKMTSLALKVPKFVLRLFYGKPNRPSRSYEELVTKYKNKLEAGGVASGRYIPKKQDAGTKEEIIEKWDAATQNYLSRIKYYWDEDKLDTYIVAHPMLGKITIRELAYFTIYHTQHHLKTIRQRNREAGEIAAS
ncbi:MAG: DinB family protein [Sphingobacteriales bacterium]|nr:MAG: DinB family protein [Sphingobacteriales bacterium]